jgi:hypothetical protein
MPEGDPLKKVSAGDPLRPSARAWNTFIDTAKRVNDSPPLKTGGIGTEGIDRNTGIVRVQNSSGSNVERFGVLGINGPAITPTQNSNEFQSRVIIDGITPTTASHTGKFVVCLEPIASGKIGKAYIDGACPAKVDFNNANEELADVKNSNLVSLQGGAGTARVLWKEAGTGVLWAIILLNATRTARVKVTSAATKGSVYNGNVWVPPAAATTINAGGSGALATTDIGSSGEAIYVVNLPEVGQNTHDLTTGTPIAVLFEGRLATYAASDGKKIYEINGYDFKTCA